MLRFFLLLFTCLRCSHTCIHPVDVDTKCKKCNASGREVKVVRQGNTIYQTQGLCSGCDGKKFVIPDAEKCEGCQGEKVIKDSKILNIVCELDG
jgi:DnaJ family protein A protein 2